MKQKDEVLEELRKKYLNREMKITAPEEVGRAAIRYFALANQDLNPLYFDQEYARKTRYGGIIAPPTFVCETMYYQVGEVDETGGPARRWGLPAGMEIRAANDYEFFNPLRPDHILTAHWKMRDITKKQGRTGTLYLLEYDITYTNQYDELLALNREALIFRVQDAER